MCTDRLLPAVPTDDRSGQQKGGGSGEGRLHHVQAERP